MATSVNGEELGTFDAVVSLGPNCLPAYRVAKVGFRRKQKGPLTVGRAMNKNPLVCRVVIYIYI